MKFWGLVTLHPHLAIIFISGCPSTISITAEAPLSHQRCLGQRSWGSWLLFTWMPVTASLTLKSIIKPISVYPHFCSLCGPPMCHEGYDHIPASLGESQIHKEPLHLALSFKSKCCRNLANFLIQILFPHIFDS